MRNNKICRSHMQAMKSDWEVWKRLWVLLQVLRLSITAVPASAVNLQSCENPTNGASSCGQGQFWDDVEKKCTPCRLDFYQNLTNHNCRECKPCSPCEDGWTSADEGGCPPDQDTRCVEAPVVLPTPGIETTSSTPGDRQATPVLLPTPVIETTSSTPGNRQAITEEVAPSADLPEISINGMELTVVEGQPAVFNCFSSGSHIGSYSVSWIRVGQPMPGMVSISSGVLTFPVTKTEYSGQYYCVVRNNFIFIQETVTLHVLASQPSQKHKDEPYKTPFYALVVGFLLVVIFLVAVIFYQRKKLKAQPSDQQNNKQNQNSNGNVIRDHQDETRIEVGDGDLSNERITMLPTSPPKEC